MSALSVYQKALKLTDADGITILCENLGYGNVADDDICHTLDQTSRNQPQNLKAKDITYSPKPVKLAPESLPMMLVLLPTLT
jgi:hypothetical protein